MQLAIQNLEEEKARVSQALADWKRSGKTTPAPELALRKPQLAAARAQLSAAEAKKSQAMRNLERTKVVAPYAGRVLNKQVDIGQLLSPSAALGEIYAVDYVETRLPLKNKALKFVELPESFRHQASTGKQPTVEFRSDLGDGNQRWHGKIVRTESRTPLYEGQKAKINPETGDEYFLDGEKVYFKDDWSDDVNAQDTLLSAAASIEAVVEESSEEGV